MLQHVLAYKFRSPRCARSLEGGSCGDNFTTSNQGGCEIEMKENCCHGNGIVGEKNIKLLGTGKMDRRTSYVFPEYTLYFIK